MHLAELTYETEEERKKHRKSRLTCSFCIRFTLVALLIILLAATTTATIFILLGRGEIDDDKGIDSVLTTQSPIPTTATAKTTTTPPPPTTTTTKPPSTTTTPPPHTTTTTPPTTTPPPTTTTTIPTTTTTTPPSTTTTTTPPPTTTTTTTPPPTTTTTPPTTTTTTTTPPPTTTTTIPTTTTTTPPSTTTTTTPPPTTTTTTTPTTTTTTSSSTTTSTPPPRIFTVLISINNGERICGGSLIKKDAVLTARQCCFGIQNSTILVGGINYVEPGRQIGTSTLYKTHARNDPSLLDYGVCIIHLHAPVSDEEITTIRLPSRSQDLKTFEKYNAILSEWESTSHDGISNIRLFNSDVTIKKKHFCQGFYPRANADRTICTYTKYGSGGFCNRIVGYPLTITESDGMETQIGLASFGPPPDIARCETRYPNGYTRITKYLDMIEMFLP